MGFPTVAILIFKSCFLREKGAGYCILAISSLRLISLSFHSYSYSKLASLKDFTKIYAFIFL